MSKILEAFVDESCTQHRYVVIGGVGCDRDEVSMCEKRFADVRKRHRLYGEVKWTKVSKSKIAVYQEFVDEFFRLQGEDKLHFHSLIADTATFDHKKYNLGSSEIGFNKLVYQLLVKFGRLYGDSHRFYFNLDQRTTSASLLELRSIVNNGLAKRWDIRGWPVRRLDFRDSHSSDLFQINDLLIGAIGHRKNRHHLAPNASAHKQRFVEYVTRASGLRDICRDTRRGASFSVWNFQYGK